MKILITGGAGFIGRKLALHLEKAVDEVVILDNLSKQIHGSNPSWPYDLLGNKKITLIKECISNQNILNEALKRVEAVIHLAAETGTGQSMYQLHRYTRVNIDSTIAILDMITQKHKHIKKFVFASSRSVYGEGSYSNEFCQTITPPPRSKRNLDMQIWGHQDSNGINLKPLPTKEDDCISPSSIYAATKYSIEVLGKIISENYRLSFDCLRFQNVYGEGQSLLNPYTGILSIFANLMRQNRPINIFEDGYESRDFIHVDDIIRAITLSLFDSSSIYRVINIGSGIPTPVIEIASNLKRFLKSKSEIVITGDYRLGDIRHCYADTQYARDCLGFSSSIDLNQGLSRFCNWVLTQPIENIQAQEAQDHLMKLGLGKSTTIKLPSASNEKNL